MTYIDTGIIVSALYLRDAHQERCASVLEEDAVTSTHALAEAFATLTGQYRVRNDIVTESLLSLEGVIAVETIKAEDYRHAIKEAKARGVIGGLIYDALHATVARRLEVEKLLTFNISNFEHVAPDLNVVAP